MSGLIRDIVERQGTSARTPDASENSRFGTTSRGFPQVQHRSSTSSAFARARATKKDAERLSKPPAVNESDSKEISLDTPPVSAVTPGSDDWRAAISKENDDRLKGMSEEDKAAERDDILERYGPEVLDLVRRVAMRRKESGAEDPFKGGHNAEIPFLHARGWNLGVPDFLGRLDFVAATAREYIHEPTHASRPTSPLPSAIKSSTTGAETPPRSPRKTRFSDVPPNVHVYESAPSSPKRQAIALLGAPGPEDHVPEANRLILKPSQLGRIKAQIDDDIVTSLPTDNDTPEGIRRQWFPKEKVDEPSLEWLKETESDFPITSSAHRYDLSGRRIASAQQASLPTHLGLHHHGQDPSQAGYTLEEIAMLCRSTVPAQRASMLGVLSNIVRAAQLPSSGDQEESLQSTCLSAAIDCLALRGTVGPRAVDLLWTCLSALSDAEGKPQSKTDLPVQVPDVLHSIAIQLSASTSTLPGESSRQLLDIVLWFAASNKDAAQAIMDTKGLVTSLLSRFVLSVFPSANPGSGLALQAAAISCRLIRTLCEWTRSTATRVVHDGVADVFLRFVSIPNLPPSSSDFDDVFAETLGLYTSLAQYGLYTSHISLAMASSNAFAQSFTKLPRLESSSIRVASQLLGLLEVLTICSIDPHRTTPSHDVIWSQMAAYNWVGDAMSLTRSLPPNLTSESPLWNLYGPCWRVLTAWIKGNMVNNAHAGQKEANEVLHLLQEASYSILGSIDNIMFALQGDTSNVIKSAQLVMADVGAVDALIGLVLAISDSSSRSGNVSTVPSFEPGGQTFVKLQALHEKLSGHILWRSIRDPLSDVVHSPLRHLSLLSSTTAQLLQQAQPDPRARLTYLIPSLPCLLPGDEGLAEELLRSILSLGTDAYPDHVTEIGPDASFGQVLLPFYVHALERRSSKFSGGDSKDENHILAPLVTTPRSINEVTTLRYCQQAFTGASLPLRQDWCFAPLDDLLRSGSSRVFQHLPKGWNFSEVEVVQAILRLSNIIQNSCNSATFGGVAMRSNHVVFGCMQIFMLEHGQIAGVNPKASAMEVFRDDTVSKEMKKLLAPFKISSSPSRTTLEAPSIESVATRYLGPSTTFYQFYSDLVGLYDSISFGDETFGTLLLPPLASSYSSDYRKLVWGDYPQLVTLLRLDPRQVIGSSVNDWLYPIEKDPEVIRMYIRALSGTGRVSDFLRWIALHHVACNVWPDLNERSEEERALKRRQQVLIASLTTASDETVSQLTLYRQHLQESTVSLPTPDWLMETDEDTRRRRLVWLQSWAPRAVVERLRGLLAHKDGKNSPGPVTARQKHEG